MSAERWRAALTPLQPFVVHRVAVRLSLLLMAILTAVPISVGSCAADTPTPAQDTQRSVQVASQVVFDDFLGPEGSAPNPDLWVADVGSSAEKGWEQGSLQTYTDSPENIRLDGQGFLIIEARKSGDHYTSGRLVTRGKMNFPFGTVSARMKLPSGQGIWPAFWMLGSNIDTVGWPQSGEIDIMELVGSGTEYNVALHGPNADVEAKGHPVGDLTEQFHTYWVTREKDDITIGIDDFTLGAFTPESLPPGGQWVFNDPMFALLNVAVGGDWPGPPDQLTPFPVTMKVDWFRFDPSTS